MYLYTLNESCYASILHLLLIRILVIGLSVLYVSSSEKKILNVSLDRVIFILKYCKTTYKLNTWNELNNTQD